MEPSPGQAIASPTAIVRRTCDDSLAYDAPVGRNHLRQTQRVGDYRQRYATLPIPVGASVSLIDPNTGVVIGNAKVISENPAFANQTFAAGETISLTLDNLPAGAANGMGVIDNDVTLHGSGSVMQYNLVQQGVFSRGIWLSGVTGIAVHDNLIQQTSKTGIFVQQLNGSGAQNGPSSNITITNNLVDNAINYGGPSIGPIVAAASIHTVAEDANADQVASSPHNGIVVTGNRVTNSTRTAIRLENVNGGSITGNIIQGYGMNPGLNLYIIPGCCESSAQYLVDFSMPILTTNTQAIVQTGNAMNADNSGLLSISSTAGGVPKVAPGSIAAAYGSNLASATAVSVTDSQGTTLPAAIVDATPGQVNFFVPNGLAPGIATVTIGSQSGGVLVDSVAPGLFSANSTGSGVAAAGAAIYSADGSTVTLQNVASCPSGAGNCVAVALSLGGPTDQLVLTLYATGLRGFSGLQNVSATIGTSMAKVLYAGAQGQFAGLDQVNLVVPQCARGGG